MASDGKDVPKGADDSPGGNAIDGLTPPTMKYAGDDGGERTQIGPSPSSAGLTGSSKISRASAATITGNMTGINPSLTSGISVQDLSSERLLRDAPRIDANGQSCPALGKIPLLAKIGQGGMGAVYYGIHPRLQSEVAVKVLPFHLAEQDPGMIKRFYREAQIAAMVRSPHLVNVMDVNEESGLFFLVMEYVPGKTAGQFLKATFEERKTGLSELDALNICIAATAGLCAAHASGIVHRDLKPDNIMLPYASRNSKDFDLMRSKLMDLGLARNEESNQSLTGVQAAMGTPGYMAPEQALDAKTADKRSDVFGMGATMYALLCGKPPFRGEAIMKVLMATMHEPHEPVIKVRPDVSQTFSEIIDKCLDKKQDNRFQDGQQLLKALRHCRKQIAPAADEDGDDDSGESVSPAAMSAVRSTATKTVIGVGPGSSIEKTLLTVPGATPAKSKTMLYVAGAAAVVLLAGGAWLTLRPKKGNEEPADTNNVVKGPDGKGKDEDTKKIQPSTVKLTEEEIGDIKYFHGTFIEKAQSKALLNDTISAQRILKSADEQLRKLPADDPNLKALIAELQGKQDAVSKMIKDADGKKEFNQRLKEIDDALVSGTNLESIQELVSKAKQILPNDAGVKSIIDQKRSEIEALIEKRDTRKSFDDLISQARDLQKKDKLEDALQKIADARLMLPEDEDGKRLEGEYKAIAEKKTNETKYKSLVSDAKKAESNNLLGEALTKALAAQRLFPENPEATAIVERLNKNISDVEKANVAAQETTQKQHALLDSLTTCSAFVDKQDYEKATDQLKIAFAIAPVDERVVELQKKISTGIEVRKQAEALAARNKQMDKLMASINTSLDNDDGDLDNAKKAIANLKLIEDSKSRAESADAKLKNRLEYNKFVANADKALQSDSIPEAADNVQQALGLFKEGAKAKGLREIVQVKLKAKQEELAKNKIQFDKYTEIASKFENSGDVRNALESILEAKKFAVNPNELATRETALRKKVGAFEEIAKVRMDFSKKLKLADDFAAATKFEEAQKTLEDAQLLLKDKDQTAFASEFGQLKTKTEEYKSKSAAIKAEGEMIAQALLQSKEKITGKDLDGALVAFKKIPAAYMDRPDIKTLSTTLGGIRAVTLEIQATVQNATVRQDRFDGKLKNGKGDAEKAKIASALASLQALPAIALVQFAAANFKDTNVTSGLNIEKDRITREIENLFQTLDRLAAAREETVKPPDRTPDRSPPPKEKSKGSVGEQGLDD